MKIKKISVLILTMIILFVGQFSYGDKVNSNNVYMIVLNKLTISDIEKMPNLKKLINEGNIGLMNTRGMSGYNSPESFATISSSDKTYASNESSQFYNLDSEYREIYENRVGILEREYDIGNIQIGTLYNQNENNNYSPNIGVLGDELHELNLKTAVFGNSDTDEDIIRTSALIPMDSNGLIDYGNLDNILIDDNDYPYGIKTDYKKMLNEIIAINSKAALIIADTGDLARLNTYSQFLSLDVFESKRSLILNDIDEFIGELSHVVNKKNSLLMILSPNSGEERINKNRLTPIILWGNGINQGIVISNTTNREGIVSNLDIGPTVADYFDLSLKNMSGNPVKNIEKNQGLDYIKNINDRINLTSKVRSKTLLFYAVMSIIIILLSGFIFFLKIKSGNKILKILNMLLVLIYGIPMIFILSSIFRINNLFLFFTSLFIITIMLLFCIKIIDNKKIIYFLSFFYFFILIIDLLFNGAITKFSVLSHDPIIGARYFGIGNEMVGIFLAVSTIFSGLLYNKYNKKIFPICTLLLAIIMVGHPRLGANVGGTIAFLVGIIYYIFNITKKQFNFKNIIMAIFIIGLIIMALGYIDIFFNPNTTHLGKNLLMLHEKEMYFAQNIINRKLLMNIKLVGVSIWTKVLFVNILVQIMMSYIFKNKVRKLFDSGLGKGILSGIVGSIAGFLVNDSGVMLSAISMNLITIFLVFIIMGDQNEYKIDNVELNKIE